MPPGPRAFSNPVRDGRRCGGRRESPGYLLARAWLSTASPPQTTLGERLQKTMAAPPGSQPFRSLPSDTPKPTRQHFSEGLPCSDAHSGDDDAVFQRAGRQTTAVRRAANGAADGTASQAVPARAVKTAAQLTAQARTECPGRERAGETTEATTMGATGYEHTVHHSRHAYKLLVTTPSHSTPGILRIAQEEPQRPPGVSPRSPDQQGAAPQGPSVTGGWCGSNPGRAGPAYRGRSAGSSSPCWL